MTERVRKRISKWDVKEVPDKFPIGARQGNALFGRSSENTNHNGSKQEWNSPKNTASNTNWSDTNPDSAIKSEDNSKLPCLQPPGNIAGHKDANVIGDFDGVSQNMKMQDGNGIYSRSTSPVRDGWRQQSRSRSPKCGWSKSHRSRSRSPRYGLKNRSRSPQHGLTNRSESPPHGLVRNPEGRNDRIRGRSVSLCNDFARGRCRRGSQCRFLHEETNRYEATRHSGSVPGENTGNRHERGGSSGNPSSEDRGYSRERLSHGHNSQMNNRSSDRCINFLKGNCHRGSSCRFIHENTKGDDHGSGTRERTHGNDTQSYPEHGHTREPYRSNNTPCRYFLMGNCRKGNSCMFSHGGAVHGRPEGGSADDRPGHSIGNVDKLWGGPKWSDEVTDSTQGSGEGISLNYRPSRIANSSSDGPVWNQKPTWNDNEVADVRSADNRWGHNLRDERKSVGGPNWRNDVVIDSTQGSGEGISLNYRPSHIANSSSDGPVWNQKPTWNDNGVADVRSADNRWGQNLRDERKSVGGPNWRNDVPDSANFSAEGWSMNDRGGHIAQSGWDNLAYCKPLLDPKLNIEAAEDRPRGRLDDERQDHNLDGVNKSLGDSKRGDEVAESVNDSAKGKSMNDVRGCTTSSRSDDTGWTNQLTRPTWNDEAADSEEKKCPQGGDNGSSGQVGDNVEYKSLGGTTWSNSAPESEVKSALGRRNDVDNRIDYSVDDQNKTWGVSTLSDNPSDQDVHRSAPWINDGNSVSRGVQLPEGHGELPTFRNTPSSRAEGDRYPDIRNSEKSGLGIQDLSSLSHVTMFSQEQCSQEVSGQRYYLTAAVYPEGQQRLASTVMTHPDASNMNTQSQQTVLFPAPDLNGPIKGVPSPNRPTLFQMVEKIKAGKIDPEISPITSGTLVSPNAVTSEQVAQLSHLSASLAQIFGNSQQLPQLYATLNPTPVVPSYPNSIQVGASGGESFVSSNQDSWSQKQYDPVNDSMESSQISDHPPGFSGYPIKQNNMANHESQTPLQSSVLPSVAGGSTGNNPIMYDNLLHQQSNKAKQLHSVWNERVVDDAVKEHDTAHSGDTNADTHMDGDKKCKDVKGMRMFKFALVGFVKEALKPIWKEGLLTKEAHKTIVKKVVDKVTGSVDLVPQTQNKIDQYLAYSKTKLTKLVEAYLEKYVKS